MTTKVQGSSVFETHGEEIKTYVATGGVECGRLLYGMAILSDCQEMLDTGSNPEDVQEEINEAKELLSSVIVRVKRASERGLFTSVSDPVQLAYVHHGYARCPFCHSEDIEGGFVEVEAASTWQKCHCNDCGEAWNDLYTLTGFERRH